ATPSPAPSTATWSTPSPGPSGRRPTSPPWAADGSGRGEPPGRPLPGGARGAPPFPGTRKAHGKGRDIPSRDQGGLRRAPPGTDAAIRRPSLPAAALRGTPPRSRPRPVPRSAPDAHRRVPGGPAPRPPARTDRPAAGPAAKRPPDSTRQDAAAYWGHARRPTPLLPAPAAEPGPDDRGRARRGAGVLRTHRLPRRRGARRGRHPDLRRPGHRRRLPADGRLPDPAHRTHRRRSRLAVVDRPARPRRRPGAGLGTGPGPAETARRPPW